MDVQALKRNRLAEVPGVQRWECGQLEPRRLKKKEKEKEKAKQKMAHVGSIKKLTCPVDHSEAM